MLDADRHRGADALSALPRFGVGPSLVEGDALPGGVPRAGDRDRVQTAVVDVLLDATEIDAAGQHIGEKTVIQPLNLARSSNQRVRYESMQAHAYSPAPI